MTPQKAPERNRRDHILPRDYLEGFTDTSKSDGVLHVFDIEKKNWLKQPTSPLKVGAERGYYDYSTDAEPDATADDAFLEFEAQFPRLRRELVSNGFSTWTTHCDFLVEYSQMLRARSRLFRQEFLEQVNTARFLKVEEVLETIPSPTVPGQTQTRIRYSNFDPQGERRGELFKNRSITQMREELKKGKGEFANWHWCLRISTDIPKPFVTADNAVALIGSGPPTRSEAMTDPNTIFVFPLCWQAILIGSPQRFQAETEVIHPSLLAELHKLYLNQSDCRFAYAPTQIKLTMLGVIPSAEIGVISGGLLAQDVAVKLNRAILDYDHLLICGPVFPHEVAGFSGGAKYFFPGIAGREIIDFTHWLGALLTSTEIIGVEDTAVRRLIDKAVALVPRPHSLIALVTHHKGVAEVFCGRTVDAWREAAALSAQRHIVWIPRPGRRILAIMPEMYADLWTGAKGMYKSEPAVADGGEVVIFAPHIREVSQVHGRLIEEIGYHCRDYFLGQWERFRNYPGGVLAHSTHVKGKGAYEAVTGVETPRIQVTLATGIPEAICRRINLGYLDPAEVRESEWRARENDGWLVIPRAGEMLYRAMADSSPVG